MKALYYPEWGRLEVAELPVPEGIALPHPQPEATRHARYLNLEIPRGGVRRWIVMHVALSKFISMDKILVS